MHVLHFSPLPSYLDTDVLGAPVAAPPSLVASLRTLSPIVERAVRHSHSLAWSTQQMAKSVREVVFHTNPRIQEALFLGDFQDVLMQRFRRHCGKKGFFEGAVNLSRTL